MRPRAVAKMDKVTGRVVRVYPSLGEAARQNGLSKNNIYQCARRKSFSEGRYYWRYADEARPDGGRKGQRHRPVRLVDARTGEAMLVEDAECAAARAGKGYFDVLRSIHRGGLVGNYRASYI